MAASRSSPSSRRARGKSCRSPGGSQPSSLPAHRASRESARTLWHDTRQVPSQRGGASLGRSRQLLANDVSFDHLVGDREQLVWNLDAERLSGLEVNHQLELGRLLDRQIGRLRTSKYLVYEAYCAPIQITKRSPIRHQPPSLGKLPQPINRGQAVISTKFCNLL